MASRISCCKDKKNLDQKLAMAPSEGRPPIYERRKPMMKIIAGLQHPKAHHATGHAQVIVGRSRRSFGATRCQENTER